MKQIVKDEACFLLLFKKKCRCFKELYFLPGKNKDLPFEAVLFGIRKMSRSSTLK
jgi:hypothetical protein